MEQQPGLLRQKLCQVLEGPFPWGSVAITAGHYGRIRYRLIVYPPGISDTQRRWLRLWRVWPLWGVVGWICLQVGLSGLVGPWEAVIISTAACLGCGIVAAVRAGESRHRVCTLTSLVMADRNEPGTAVVRDKLLEMSRSLLKADAMLRKGEISVAAYEMTWWRVYRRASCTLADGSHQ